MSLPYSTLGRFTGSIQSGSFLNAQDTNLFYVSQSKDVWFGFSPNDAIEISAYDTNDNSLLKWSVIHQDKQYKKVTLSYSNTLDVVNSYTYNELISDFTQYKNDKILVNPIEDLNSIGITEGNLNVSYVFTKHMAGTPSTRLTIKEISPSRTEIKLIPVGSSDVSYAAFCLKKFTIKDVASVILTVTQNCPYDQIYRLMQPAYSEQIDFIKTIFFLKDDGAVLLFLKNLYEDYIKYTTLSESQLTNGHEPTKISRIQGIRSDFNNYIVQNYETISDFSSIESKMSEFINKRVAEKFKQYTNQNGIQYKNARGFIYDFFFKYFYQNGVKPFEKLHQTKYFGYFKNVINFGDNQYYHILTHDFIDERVSPTDSLTLVLKLAKELPSDYSIKSTCWVSNFSMAPYVFTARLQNPVKHKTIKISPPNFGITNQFITKENVNKMYSSDDLAMAGDVENNIKINKSASEMNVDYSNYENFIVFSSAVIRHDIFKNKMIGWTTLSSSLSELNDKYDTAISSSLSYPYYITEKEKLESQISNLIGSFDGYESYLFNSKNYEYSIDSGEFISSSYISEQNNIAQEYDSNNRDNLVSNTPEYISNDSENEQYLSFLSMVGHHFDNIYTYISALPIERQVKNELSSSIPTNTLKEMLYSFGWNVDDIIGNLDVDEIYLNSLTSNTYNVLSAEQRLQTIWNRILVTLPGIYKTKGTEECVKYLMSCYGLPSSLINIREYGGTDSSDDTEPTYKLDEKTYMLSFTGSNDYIEGPFPLDVNTVEFKFSAETDEFDNYKYIPLFSVFPHPFTDTSASAWSIGISKSPGRFLGTLQFSMGSGSTNTNIVSDILPIFNGDIFSVMLRKNSPDENFEFNSSSNSYPLKYDLTLQRNEDGRRIFYSTSSVILNVVDNSIFNQYGRFRLSDGTFKGTIDKLSIWNVPIEDKDFEEHVNDINSYGYSGSNVYQNLLVRLSVDYPKSMYYNLSGSSAVWINNESSYYSIPNYYSTPENLSSSIDADIYSASVDIINNRWTSFVPTGSIEIIGYNFSEVLHPNWSALFDTTNCNWISSSVYPFSYREFTYQQDINASKYGPNKYKNKKIRKIEYDVEARFDSNDRSTNQVNSTISGETNQLGFFIDPQESKNKDIIRYVGNSGIMEFISDPSDIFSDRYSKLKNKNHEYHAAGDKKTYFNELITVYKFYFDKSIFQAIKNVLPARANSFTGVVIEPTLLERPKYQNRPLTSDVQISYKNPGIINDIYTVSDTVLWANFNTEWSLLNPPKICANGTVLQKETHDSLPPNYQDTIDLTRINEPIRIRSNNLNCGYVTDEMDVIQRCVYGDYEKQIRGWEVNQQCKNWIYGSTSRQKTGDLPSINTHHAPIGVDETGMPAVFRHQILYYTMKVWEKYYYYAKTGEYVRNDNPNEDVYDSASVYLYRYQMFDEKFMNEKVHFFNNYVTSVASYTPVGGAYQHKSNTFKNTPDQTVSNVFAINPVYPFAFNVGVRDETYFELTKGYPRNHGTHKLQQFTLSKYPQYVDKNGNSIYIKGRNTINGTINENGLDDGTYPIQSFNVSNVNVKNSSNVIRSVVTSDSGTKAKPTNTSVSSI